MVVDRRTLVRCARGRRPPRDFFPLPIACCCSSAYVTSFSVFCRRSVAFRDGRAVRAHPEGCTRVAEIGGNKGIAVPTFKAPVEEVQVCTCTCRAACTYVADSTHLRTTQTSEGSHPCGTQKTALWAECRGRCLPFPFLSSQAGSIRRRCSVCLSSAVQCVSVRLFALSTIHVGKINVVPAAYQRAEQRTSLSLSLLLPLSLPLPACRSLLVLSPPRDDQPAPHNRLLPPGLSSTPRPPCVDPSPLPPPLFFFAGPGVPCLSRAGGGEVVAGVPAANQDRDRDGRLPPRLEPLGPLRRPRQHRGACRETRTGTGPETEP